jgi:hypothetical protein
MENRVAKAQRQREGRSSKVLKFWSMGFVSLKPIAKNLITVIQGH